MVGFEFFQTFWGLEVFEFGVFDLADVGRCCVYIFPNIDRC